MKSLTKRALYLCLSLILVFGLAACSAAGGKKAERLSLDARPDAPSEIPEGLDIDWNARYTFAELEAQLSQMAEQYPDITDLYSIGTTWQERDLWCLEITNKAIPAEEKTGIGVFANIHGGERESASSAMYTAWWLTLCSDDAYVKGLLDTYTIYVIPVINPDGYEQSFVVNTRPNLRPQDANGNNIPFSDPYTDIDALVSLHTGIQSVLYPWCYRAYDAENPDDAEIPFMKQTAAQMAQAFQDYTGRGFYSMSSNEDYPTAAELIDYAYGRYNIHAYTIEVYSPGKSENGDISSCKWENTMPEAKWVFYSRDEIRDTLGLDPDAITDKDGVGLAADEGLWFYTSPTNQMVSRAPEEQDVMVRGCRDAILTMLESEPSGAGYQNPGFYK